MSTRTNIRLITAIFFIFGCNFAVAGSFWDLFKTMEPSENAKYAGQPVSVDLSEISPGTYKKIIWRGRPVVVIHLTSESIGNLDKLDGHVWNKGPISPINGNYYAYGIVSTHLGCIVEHVPPAKDWLGGWVDPCHGLAYDYAGRALKPSKHNLNNDEIGRVDNLKAVPYDLEDNFLIIGRLE